MTYLLAILLFQTQGPRPPATAPTPPPVPTTAPPIYGYIPIILFFLIAMALPFVLLGLSRLIQRRVYEREKLLPYECGVEPIGDARDRFSVRFYIVAMLFLVFDVEVVFLFPWAIIYDKLAIFGLVEMLVFIGILVVGYYYAWRKGALEWA
ncbi:MAG TPA: NADH-quinone oxidoreductase subunit A [Blastocatellia bacterium]|nr:NADH-quinone oxidoreductase subunit A [Blastocatellia bacterium]